MSEFLLEKVGKKLGWAVATPPNGVAHFGSKVVAWVAGDVFTTCKGSWTHVLAYIQPVWKLPPPAFVLISDGAHSQSRSQQNDRWVFAGTHCSARCLRVHTVVMGDGCCCMQGMDALSHGFMGNLG